MNKKVLLGILVLAVLVGALTVFASAETVSRECQACGEVVSWEPLNPKAGKITASGHYHYYLPQSYTGTQTAQFILENSALTVCLDLNGYTFATNGRSMIAKGGGSVLNIMDSSAAGTGVINGSTAGNNPGGGTLVAKEHSTVNLYGGTLRFVKRTGYSGTGRGGVVQLESTGVFNMYGGRVEGAEMVMSTYYPTGINGCGGAVFVYAGGAANFYGGTVTSGTVPEGGKAPCVYLESATANVTLSGSANVEHIYAEKANNIKISGAYTGRTRIFYGANVAVKDQLKIGTSANADLSGANILCVNGDGWNVVTSGAELRVKPYAPTGAFHWCTHCRDYVNWLPMASNIAKAQQAGHHHLYMDGKYETAQQFSTKNQAVVCLDLYGQTFDSSRRALHVATDTQLNLMDSVGGGTVLGHTGTNNPDGGVAVVQTGSVLNMYSGKLEFIKADAGYGTGRGGIMTLSGTLNVYGGTIQGGEMVKTTYNYNAPVYNGYGGAIHMLGTKCALNVMGGQILSGSVPADCYGPCVFVEKNNAKITLSGNAVVEDICYTADSSTSLTISGTFTGRANLSYLPSVEIAEGSVVGSCANADITAATLQCGELLLVSKDGQLCCSTFGPNTVAGVHGAAGAMGYHSLEEALEAYTDGYIQLLKPVTGDFLLDQTLVLDLNGNSIDGTVTVADGTVLYGMDSQTDDYDVADGIYGKLSVVTQGTGKVTGATITDEHDNYLMVTEGDLVSFHRVTLQIYAMTLRPQVAGLYYNSRFLADQKAAPAITSFGIALSTQEVPNGENMEQIGAFTTFTGFAGGPSGNGDRAGTLLKNILQEENGYLVNLQNLNTSVYGIAYAKTAEGCLLGMPVCRSLLVQMEDVDAMTEQLSNAQTAAVTDMYTTYKTVFSNRELPGIAKELRKQQGEYLRILMIGNSHGSDATQLLYEVFKAEKPEQKVLIGRLYYGGCTMPMHAQHATGNEKVYEYYKIDDANVDSAWNITKNRSILDALEDEQWDIVVMQQQNEQNGIEGSWNATAFKTVINYVYEHQPVKPRLLWQMLWVNPDNYSRYIGTGAPLAHPNAAWYQTYYETNFPGADGKYDHQVLYNKIVTLTQQKLVNSNDFLGQAYYADIIPAATTVEYALDVLKRPQHEMFRDWTHLSDYGRLMVAYQWYAEIMDLEELTQVNVDTIPAELHQTKSTYPADGKVNAAMKQDILSAVNWTLQHPYELPEESREAPLCILGIGNSYTIDSMWLLDQVYRAENSGKRLKLGIAYYSGCTLAQHVGFINNKSAEYDYYFLDSATGTWVIKNDVTLEEIIADQQWEVVSMQQGSGDSGRATTYNSNIQTIQSFVETTLGYKPTYFWNMTWAYPEVDITTDKYTLDNAPNAYAFKNYYNSNQLYMYGKITETVQQKIVPDESFAWIMPVGTTIQNANSGYLTDHDLYRDYTHLNDFARVMAAYTWYCKLENKVPDTAQIQKVDAALTKSYTGGGDMLLTDAQRDIIAESVKNALTTPFAVTQSTYTQKP